MMTNYVVHVGVVLEEHLSALGITQKQLSEQTGISTTVINEIIKCKRNVNASYAKKLEPVFGLPAKYWLGIQNDYDLALNDSAIEKLDFNQSLEFLPYTAKQVTERFLAYENDDAKKYKAYERSITPLKLQKLLYFAYKKVLSLGKVLFKDTIVHQQYGPVVKNIYKLYNKSSEPIVDLDVKDEPLDEEIEKAIFEVYKKYRPYTAWYLVEESHKESCYKNTKMGEVITPEMIRNSI